jgi:uncharacterized protein
MPMPDAISNLASLSLGEVIALSENGRLPPVSDWHPKNVGAIDIRIARDGRWFHEGGEIKRANMVRLFSTILRRESDGRHVLVTPAEKLDIVVEDTAFIAVELKSEGEGPNRTLAFRLNTGDIVVANQSHMLDFNISGGEPRPILHVRSGLEARLTRAVFLEIANIALHEEHNPPAIWSNGCCFSLEKLL